MSQAGNNWVHVGSRALKRRCNWLRPIPTERFPQKEDEYWLYSSTIPSNPATLLDQRWILSPSTHYHAFKKSTSRMAQAVKKPLQCGRHWRYWFHPWFNAWVHPWVGPWVRKISPEEGNGNPLHYSCLENPMNREAWWATVHGVAKNETEQLILSLSWTLGWMQLYGLVFSFSLDTHPAAELLGHAAIVFVGFWGTSILFSSVAALIYIPTNSSSVKMPFFPHPHQRLSFCLLDDSHSDRYKVISHCGFDLHFSDD